MTDAPPVIPAAAPAPASVPGKTLGLVAIPVAIFFSLIGIILGFVAKSQSKKAGYKNTPATIAIVIGFLVLIGSIIAVVVAVAGASALFAQCADLGPGIHELDNGVTVTCG
jgi:uncharacterized membrane protein